MIVECCGEELELLPEKAIFWPARRMLLVADLHLGKAATFRAHGAPVPEHATYDTLDRLSCLIDQKKPDCVSILGDLFHARESVRGAPRDAFLDWRKRHENVSVNLIVGNHDRRALGESDEFGPWLQDALIGPFHLAHYPNEAENYVLAGHIHPGFRLAMRGFPAECLPCFWFSERVAVLPAFGTFTGMARIEPLSGDCVYLVANRDIVPVRL